ncbi:hypothetical protein [Hyalangium rubrum]|uniref:Uncharacterized protein n=1 Tax=Hyalangium rubrum TaxID=3103134 RepID=A0ABU5H301_9BACT|nr:hypothetical protein [Hyalangium sp. s54d21]MDY7227482.1 hypothetical protein [Hyalangium sp. s54d21]
MRRGFSGAWGLLLALLVSSAGLAQSPPAPPAPAPASPQEELTEELLLEEVPDAGTEELVETEATAVEAPVAEVPEEEEPRPSGYADSTGNLENLDDADGLRVSVRAGTLRAERGYTPVEVVLQNSDNVPRPVQLSFRGYGSGSPTTRRALELAPRQRLTTHLLVPAAVQSGTFSVEGPNLRTRTAGVYLDDPSATSTLVLGASKAFEASTGMGRSDDNSPPQVNTRFLSAQDAPRELAAYVGYDVVMVTEEATSVPADVWAVLENYAALGGALLLAKPPRDVGQRLPMLPERPASKEWNAYGFGGVYLCQDGPANCALALSAVSAESAPPLHAVGPAPRWETSRAALRGGESPLLPNALAPVGRFLVLIFLFSLVVGPGGLILARRKGPAAMLIGVPAVAIVTCLLIIGDSLLGDGFVTHSSRYSYTFLDRPRDRAITSAVAGYYANLASEKVQMPSMGVLLAPGDVDEWTVEVDWAGGGMVADGFLPSRTYTEWGELAVVPTRARLVVRREGAGVRVQNALGAPIESGAIQVAGKRYLLRELADGAETLVTEVLREAVEEPIDKHVAPPVGMKRRTQELEDFTRALPDQSFVVRLGGRGFAPLASLPVEMHEGVHFVRGQVDGP